MHNDYEPWVPAADKQLQEMIDEQRRKYTSSVGVIDDVLAWFEEMIIFYGSTDSLEFDETTPDDQVKLGFIIAKKLKQQYEQQYADFRRQYGAQITEQTEETPEATV